MGKHALKIIVAINVLIAVFVGPALAQEPPGAVSGGMDRMVGGLIVAVPDYEGSDDYEIAPAPMVKFTFQGQRYFQIDGNSASINLLNHDSLEFGPLAVFRLGRDDVDDSAVDAMADVDDSFELGVFVAYVHQIDDDPRHHINFGLDVSQDVSDGHDGFVIEVGGTYWRPLSPKLNLGFGVSSAYASDDYMSSFFDVSTSDSAASGLSTYDADSGIKDIGLSLFGIYSFNQNWHMTGTVNYKRLLNDAADSPVTDDAGSENQFFAGIGILYSW